MGVVVKAGQEGGQFGSGPGHTAAVPVGSVARRDGQPGGVACVQQPAGDGVVEDVADEQVDLMDGLGRQPTVTVTANSCLTSAPGQRIRCTLICRSPTRATGAASARP